MKKKYIHPNLKIVVPLKLRIKIYKTSIRLLKEKEYLFGAPNIGLCLLLPCVLWNFEHYLNHTPTEENWDYKDTPIAFPELTEEILNNISQQPGSLQKEYRLIILQEMLIMAQKKLIIN